MGQLGKRDAKRAHSLFVDDLKVYQEGHKSLKDINQMIVQTKNNDTGGCYGEAKCAEVVFERGKMVKGEGLQVLNKRMQTLDPDENEIYVRIKKREVYNRMKEDII